jgi:hypothetical protein
MGLLNCCFIFSNEYDILPQLESTTNRNPVFVVEHKLAIEAWAAHIMLCTAVGQLSQLQIKTDGRCPTDGKH